VVGGIGQTDQVPLPLAPWPTIVNGRRVVAPDVDSIDARLRFDVVARQAMGEALIRFTTGDESGHPALDLRQQVEWLRLDGEKLAPEAFAPLDLGAGPGSEVRVLDVTLEAGSRHRLEVGYQLETPAATGSEPIGWVGDGVRFDLWMSDLYPGRYLEMWVPAPLIHDRFALKLDIELLACDRPHVVIANTDEVEAVSQGGSWTVRYPEHFTSLSPMLVVAPTDEIELRHSSVNLVGRERSLEVVCARRTDVDVDLGACDADIRSWLLYNSARYGPWVHGHTFWAFLWGHGRGMEYDGATTASVGALEHEVLHSWFGRGVKPARATDGWIDEAWASWATASRRTEQPRFASEELGLEDPPVELYLQHPWARQTPVAAYTAGARLFAGLAFLLGGPERLRSAMADWYRGNAGRAITTDGLAAHLTAWSGIDIGAWWARYVHGRD
jgi:hypothetical protein